MAPMSASTSRPTASTSAQKSSRSTADYSLSCAECRRLKLKCSRQQWPCESCIKRGIPHLCPDGVQKQRGRMTQDSMPSAPNFLASGTSTDSNAGNASFLASAGSTYSLVWSRLDGLERKLDMLIEASSIPPRTSSKVVGPASTTHLLHDLASIATDHYAMENDHENNARAGDDNTTTREQLGSLTLHPDGRAHYLGSNAHSMYLAQENFSDPPEGRKVSFREELISRPGSPTPVDLEAAATDSNARRKSVEIETGSPSEGNAPSTMESQRLQLVWATPGFRSPHSSTAIWNQLKSALPSREMAQRMIDVYYATVTFMFHPISRNDFEKSIWVLFYSNSITATSPPPLHFHPHKLALLFSILSLGILLDVQRPQRDPVGRALYSCAWIALALSNFTEATSLEAILALMHINMYLTWRRGGRYAESAYPLLGTMIRMAISTGLHRDPSLFNLDEEEREKRRRVFWDVQCSEVFRAFAFCRPPALCDRHVDTRFPSEWQLGVEGERGIVSTMPKSSSHREGIFHAFKCKQVQVINRMLDECLCAKSSFQITLHFDKIVRQMLTSMPAWMLPTLVESQKDVEVQSSKSVEDLERAYNDVPFRDEMILELQRHTTLLNHFQAILLLHREWFSKALQQDSGSKEGGGKVGNGRQKSDHYHQQEILVESVQAVNESASKVIAITISAWCKYPSLVIRWAFFWNAIFSAAVCRGLYIIKRETEKTESEKAWQDLVQAIELLEKAVIGWTPLESPLHILNKLKKRAETVMRSRGRESDLDVDGKGDEDDREAVDGDEMEEEEEEGEEEAGGTQGEDLTLIGDGSKRKKRKSAMKKSASSIFSSQKKKKSRSEVDTTSQEQSTALNGENLFEYNRSPEFDVSSQTADQRRLFSSSTLPTKRVAIDDSTTFVGADLAPLLYSEMLPSVFTNQAMNPIQANELDFITSLDSPSTSSTASASQLIQMLSNGLSWDDVSSWNDLIVDL
ncbi:hypothetical protein CBS101457_005942 [Exobasidium rhododendri]|nr:hypothetical protein CBS101457_005942 [Exobasidium rhododendri]